MNLSDLVGMVTRYRSLQDQINKSIWNNPRSDGYYLRHERDEMDRLEADFENTLADYVDKRIEARFEALHEMYELKFRD